MIINSDTKHEKDRSRFCLEIRPYGNYCPHGCDFCYQNEKTVDTVISIDTAIQVFEMVLQYMSLNSMRELKLVFHGGEPAHDGGRKIFEIVDNAHSISQKNAEAINIHYLCHTSGFTEIDIDGFSKRNIYVCVNRPIPNKLPVKKKTLFRRNIESLLDYKLLSKQIIVITKETTQSIDECLDAISEFGLPTKLQPQFPPYPTFMWNDCYPSIDDLLTFIDHIMHQAINANIDISKVEPINRFINYNRSITKLEGCRFSEECTLSEGIVRSMAVDPDGTVFACNRFAGVGAYPLAVVNDSALSLFDDIKCTINNIKLHHGYRTPKMTRQCRSCTAGIENACPATGGCPFFAYIWKMGCLDPYCAWDSGLYSKLHKVFVRSKNDQTLSIPFSTN